MLTLLFLFFAHTIQTKVKNNTNHLFEMSKHVLRDNEIFSPLSSPPSLGASLAQVESYYKIQREYFIPSKRFCSFQTN